MKPLDRIAAFYDRTGDWGLELLGSALEHTTDLDSALAIARRQFNLNPTAPPTAEEEKWSKVEEAIASLKSASKPARAGRLVSRLPHRPTTTGDMKR